MSLSGGAEDEELSESELTGISISGVFFLPPSDFQHFQQHRSSKKTSVFKPYLIKYSYRANISRKQSECMCEGLSVNTNLLRDV